MSVLGVDVVATGVSGSSPSDLLSDFEACSVCSTLLITSCNSGA